MIKKFASILLIILTTILFCSCSLDYGYKTFSTANLSKEWTYTYSVSCVDHPISNSVSTKNENVKLTIDNTSSFTITIKQEGNYCFYNTTLLVNGNYNIQGNDNIFADNITSSTKYIVNATGVEFVSNSKNVESEHYYANGKMLSLSYNYTLDYGKSNATLIFNSDKEQLDNAVLSSCIGEKTIKKYNKNLFIDNEFLIFFPRILSMTENQVINANTIDPTNAIIKPIKYTVDATIKDTEGFSINDQEYKDVDMTRVFISLNEKFSGSRIECYYLNSNNDDNHNILTKVFTALNDDLGYLCYSLKNITTK